MATAKSTNQIVNRIAVSAEEERAITRFLYDEAELIDNMEWDDWLTCLHDFVCIGFDCNCYDD